MALRTDAIRKLLVSCLGFAITLSAVAVAHASAFSPRFESVGAGNIPRDVVPAFAQDASGFLWIATGDGLVRYDGYRFRAQERKAQDPALRNMGWIRALLAGKDGKLWIGTESRGLSSYDPLTDSITDFGGRSAPNPSGDNALRTTSLPTIRALAQDSKGWIYLGSTGGGLEVFDPARRSFVSANSSISTLELPDNRVDALLVDHKDTLWIGTWKGLVRRSTNAERSELIAIGGLRNQHITALMQDEAGDLWVGCESGHLMRIDATSGQARPMRLPPGTLDKAPVTSLATIPGGQIWVGRTTGIQVLNADSGAILHDLRYDPLRRNGLGGNYITQMYLDPQGWLWVSGFGLGLQRHNVLNRSVALREPDAKPRSAFSHADIHALTDTASGWVWAGTAAGTIGLLTPDLQLQRALPRMAASVNALLETHDKHLWAGGPGRIHEFDRHGTPLRVIRHGGGDTRRLFESRNGALWIGTQDGVYRWVEGTSLPARLVNLEGLPKGEIHALAQDPEGRMWVGTSQGIFRSDIQGTTLTRIKQEHGATLGSDVVIGLLFDSKGTLWVDTGTAGLHRLQNDRASPALAFERISQRHGHLGKPFGANLLEDKRGRIWTQMNVYDPQSDRITEMTPAYGADIGTGWFFSYAKQSTGDMLFGASKGLLRITPDKFDESTFAPPLLITELRINGEPIAFNPGSTQLRLPGGTRSFSVEFSALDYSAPQRIQYAYQLEGFDRQWNHTNATQRVASYSNLGPGTYTLLLRASNHSGVWIPDTRRITIILDATWWQTLWFRATLCLLLGVLLFALIRLRTRQLQMRQEQLQSLIQERTQELEEMAIELQLQRDTLEESSLRDPLTGLHNRRFLLQCIDADIALVKRSYYLEAPQTNHNTRHDLLFFLIDIDHFKQVNDVHGHQTGDYLLQEFASRLESVFRDGDYVIRWGGEEFLCVARHSSRSNAVDLAERTRRCIEEQPFSLQNGAALTIACSIGFTCYPIGAGPALALGWNDAVNLADTAMYTVKQNGRNGWFGLLDCDFESQPELQQWLDSPKEAQLFNKSIRTAGSRSFLPP